MFCSFLKIFLKIDEAFIIPAFGADVKNEVILPNRVVDAVFEFFKLIPCNAVTNSLKDFECTFQICWKIVFVPYDDDAPRFF
jgi:hypothetical protein